MGNPLPEIPPSAELRRRLNELVQEKQLVRQLLKLALRKEQMTSFAQETLLEQRQEGHHA